MATAVGRLRECPVLHYKFVALSHNILRGAAGAAVLNAELMQTEGLLRHDRHEVRRQLGRQPPPPIGAGGRDRPRPASTAGRWWWSRPWRKTTRAPARGGRGRGGRGPRPAPAPPSTSCAIPPTRVGAAVTAGGASTPLFRATSASCAGRSPRSPPPARSLRGTADGGRASASCCRAPSSPRPCAGPGSTPPGSTAGG